jgi:hypothetical protein
MNDRLEISALEQLALEFRRIAAESPAPSRRRRLMPRSAIAVTAAITIAATAGAATQLIETGPPVPPAPVADFTADQRPLAGSERVSGVQTADPIGGLPWGLRLYRSESGDPCVIVGRLRDGQVGLLTGNTFRALPLSGPGNCVHFEGRDRPLSMGTRSFPPGDAPERTAIYGVASRLVTKIVLISGIETRTLVPDKDGAYLAVFRGAPMVTRIVYFADGSKDILKPPSFTPTR